MALTLKAKEHAEIVVMHGSIVIVDFNWYLHIVKGPRELSSG